MALELMYITNDPAVAVIAEEAGVDLIFVDMEFIGKQLRQGGMDTVQSRHTIEDIRAIKAAVKSSRVMVRINPIHEAGEENGVAYTDSRTEIDAAIEAGADILMLPYFKTAEEVRKFVAYVDGRAITFPLLETPEAVAVLDEILQIPGIDRIHIGLNDLSLAKKSGFMFGLLTDGTVEQIAETCKKYQVPFGFGGIAALGQGLLPAEYIIGEHYRLGSSYVILSRSFCNTQQITDLEQIRSIFQTGVSAIRELEEKLKVKVKEQDHDFFTDNMKHIESGVQAVQELIASRKQETK
ncbi:MAG: aldolase/citrate lyase family protein [Lachnospiraceae bacterium]|nr:aldolase/citrate lyase family protein [Lachnospiraceae bacterium]